MNFVNADLPPVCKHCLHARPRAESNAVVAELEYSHIPVLTAAHYCRESIGLACCGTTRMQHPFSEQRVVSGSWDVHCLTRL